MLHGGIAALVDLNRDTDGALAADILERLHVPITQAHRIGWGEIYAWARHLGSGSYTFGAKQPEYDITPALVLEFIACCADAINSLNHNLCRAYGSKGKKPDPIPRPWTEDKVKKIGSAPIPIRDFESWYYG